MSQADELLESLTSEAGDSVASENIVIGDDCFITVPESLKKIAVQYDHNVETVTFDCPRYRESYDMSRMKVYINYLRSDGVLGTCLCNNVVVDPSDSNLMHFDWTISGHVTYASGNISFLVCVRDVDRDGNEKFHWNSELNTDIYVSPGMKCRDVVLSKHPDIITQLLSRMDQTEAFVKDLTVDAIALDNGEASVEKTKVGDSMKLTFGLPKGDPGASVYQVWLDAGNTGSVEEFLSTLSGSAYQIWLDLGNTGTEADFIASLKGQNGVTFTPSVDASGNLSWTNDGGLTNPNVVNLKGADGKSVTHSWNGTVLSITSASGTSSADLVGQSGASGTKVVTITLPTPGWSNGMQTVTVQGVLADEMAQVIRPIPAISSQAKYFESEILCTAQGANSLTFSAGITPSVDLTVHVVIQEVGA